MVIWNARDENICNFKHGGQGRPRWKGTFWVKIWRKWQSELTSVSIWEKPFLGTLITHARDLRSMSQRHQGEYCGWSQVNKKSDRKWVVGAADSGASLVRTLVSHLKDLKQKSGTVRFTFEQNYWSAILRIHFKGSRAGETI